MSDFVSMWTTVTPVEVAEETAAPQPKVEPETSEPEPVDVEALVKQVRDEGLETGRKQAEAALGQLRAEIEAERAQMAELARALQDARQQELHSVRHEVADLVLLMARRVVGDAMAVHPDALRNVVMGAIGRVPGDEPVKVKVAPGDVERVSGWLAELPRFRVEADEGLEGGCVVESRYGCVEAAVETAFTALEAATRAWVDEG